MLNWVLCSGSLKVAVKVLAGTKVPLQGSTGEGSPPTQVVSDSILFFSGYWNCVSQFPAGYWPSVASWLLCRNCLHFFLIGLPNMAACFIKASKGASLPARWITILWNVVIELTSYLLCHSLLVRDKPQV